MPCGDGDVSVCVTIFKKIVRRGHNDVGTFEKRHEDRGLEPSVFWGEDQI